MEERGFRTKLIELIQMSQIDDLKLFVEANKTSEENATHLQKMYDLIKYEGKKNVRYTLLLEAGIYEFYEGFDVDTDFVDICSVSGVQDVTFVTDYINVTANHVRLSGIEASTGPFTIASNLDKLECFNCHGGDYSFGYGEDGDIVVSGFFQQCSAGKNSFGSSYNYNATASGTFLNCDAQEESFGSSVNGNATASGRFVTCEAHNRSFGCSVDGNATASGAFHKCRAFKDSFAFSNLGNATASGTFKACSAYSCSMAHSIRGDATASGSFDDCCADFCSYGYCVRGDAKATGHFKDCIADRGSFGCSQFGSTDASGEFHNCRICNIGSIDFKMKYIPEEYKEEEE